MGVVSASAPVGPLNRPVAWGVWGAGQVAAHLCQDLQRVSGARLQAVGARRLERAQAFAAAFAGARAVQGLAALLADPALDIIYIATPNHCHVDDALACLEAGKAVLVEKPFALNLAQARQVVDAARRRQRFCMEAMWMRFIPAVREAKALADAGALGRLRCLQGSFGYAVQPAPQRALFQAAAGGGALLDRGVYLLSLAQHLLGTPNVIQGQCARLGDDVDMQAAICLGYASGAQALLSASLCTDLPNDFVISGEAAQATLPSPFYRADRLRLAPVQAWPLPEGPEQGLKARLKQHPLASRLHRQLQPLRAAAAQLRGRGLAFGGHGYQFQLAEVTRCLAEGRLESPLMLLDDSLEVMRQMDELRRQWAPTDTRTTP